MQLKRLSISPALLIIICNAAKSTGKVLINIRIYYHYYHHFDLWSEYTNKCTKIQL